MSSVMSPQVDVSNTEQEEKNVTGDEIIAKHLPAESGVWAFVLGDMVIFALFFITFMGYREGWFGQNFSAVFYQSQQTLNQTLGAVNTIVLLTSSYFIVLALYFSNAQHSNGNRAKLFARLAIISGLIFVGIKGVEYYEKIAAGHTMVSNEFFMFYYIITGLHMLHVLIGMVFIKIFFLSPKQTKQEQHKLYEQKEGAALYWHMVDLLWIMIFPLLYLL